MRLPIISLTLLPAALGALALAPAAAAEGSPFGGAYAGAEAGVQNVIAGANVGGTDALAQESKAVVSLVGGYRLNWKNGVVLGAEASLGTGDLSLDQQFGGFDLTYDSNTQWSFGGIAGWVPGGGEGNTLIFAYVSETKREFDVNGSQPGFSFQQRDEQGLLRYGIGVERAFGKGWSVRGTLGTSRAEFGDRPRNIDPDNPVDVSLGLIRRL